MRSTCFGLSLVALGACPAPGDGDAAGDVYVTYTLASQAGVSPSTVFRLGVEGSAPVDVSAAVGAPAEGNDRRLVPSHNGAFLVMASDRFGGDGDLVVMSDDLVDAAAVKPGGVGVFIEGTPAISDDGQLVVFSQRSEGDGEAATVDLFTTRRSGDDWEPAVLISGDSPRAFNNMPALAFDDGAVFFDCGDEPDPETPGSNTAACVVGVDGSGFDVVATPDLLPGARENKTPQFPHDGAAGVLFEGGWPVGGDTPELVWRRLGDEAPTPLELFPNAVSPCGLRDGRTILLWLGRPAGSGAHELTLINEDDATSLTLLPGVDVEDIGVGCAG